MDDPSGPASARAYEFERFLLEILERSPDIELLSTVSSYNPDLSTVFPSYGPDLGFDMAAVRNGRTLVIEAKVTTPQTRARLRSIASQLEAAQASYARSHPDASVELVLAFPGALSRAKWDVARRSRVTIWDGAALRAMADSLGVQVPPYVAPVARAQWPDDDTAYAHALTSRLSQIAPGSDDWSAYEKYCEELLNFLFVPPLNTAIAQSRDERRVNRRDFVLPNYAMDRSIWHFMRSHYQAHFVVAEVKNLRGAPGKPEILQVANYLNPHGAGLFAIILARRELEDSASTAASNRVLTCWNAGCRRFL